MTKIVNAGYADDDRNDNRNDDRTSQSSVKDMKVRRGDVGYTDPIAKKNKTDPRFFFSAKNICAVDPDELDKTAIKSRVWGWDRSAKTWLEGADGQKAIQAIKDGTYDYNDPEHDYIWQTKAGLTALDADPLVIAFYNELYKRFRGRPDFEKQYTLEKFDKFWNNSYCRSNMADIFAEQNGLSEDQQRDLKRVLRYSTNEGYKDALDAVYSWYKDGGNRFFGAWHYADTILKVKDFVMQYQTIEDLVNNVTPEYFMSWGICQEESKGVRGMTKHNVGYVKRYAINDIYQGIVNSDVVSISDEFVKNPEHFVEASDKEKTRLTKALRAAPIANIENISIVFDKDTQTPYALVETDLPDIGATGLLETISNKFPLTEGQLDDLNSAFSNSWVVFDTNSSSIAFNCIDDKEAQTWSVAFYETYNSLVRSAARGYTQIFDLDSLTRVGYLYREGSIASEQNIKGEAYESNGKGGKMLSYQGELLERCNLSGITFGTTTSLNARTAFCNAVYDTFRDLENVLHAETSTLFGDNLALSYGASGKPPELAHYLYDSPMKMHSININYKNGYGSFGHELMHCLDSELGKKVIEDSKLSILTGRNAPMLTENFGSATDEWREALKANYPAAYALASFINDHNTAYYKLSFSLENPKAEDYYWSTPCEMFARAAAVYLENKFDALGFRNDFLSGNASMTVSNSAGQRGNPVPNAEEQQHFNGLMDAFLEEVKERGLVKDVPEMNTKSLYAERHPDEPEKYNIIVKQETTPLLHMLEKRVRLQKGEPVKINDFNPSDIDHASAYCRAALPSLETRNERINVRNIKTIIEDRETKEFAFGVR